MPRALTLTLVGKAAAMPHALTLEDWHKSHKKCIGPGSSRPGLNGG